MTIVNYAKGEIVDPLTGSEEFALETYEEIIDAGLKTFVEVGHALGTIRNARLYRVEHATFEEYCEQRWNLSRSLAYDTIAAAEIAGQLSAIADTPTPSNVGQARELAGLSPERAAETMRVAHRETEGKVTAKAIRDVRHPKTPEPARGREAIAGSGDSSASPSAAKPKTAQQDWEESDRVEELTDNLARNLSLTYAITSAERRAEYIAAWPRGVENRPVLGRNFVTPDHMRAIADALHIFANEWEQANV